MRLLASALAIALGVSGAAYSSPILGTVPLAQAGVPTLAPLLKKAAPALVTIRARSKQVSEEAKLLNDFFPLLFGFPPPEAKAEEDTMVGSGIIVDAREGLILTNGHVVEDAMEITVGLADGTRTPASIVGLDQDTDLAVIRINTPGLVALDLADSDAVQPGDFVIAVGNRFALGPSASTGIVSGLHRTSLGMNRYEDFIQTDAAINVGDSGGALLDLRGNVVGITTVILERDGANTSIGFAIPSNLARAVMTQLIAHGNVRRGQIGVQAKDAAGERATQLRRIGLPAGAELVAVHSGSQAERGGLHTGDTVTVLERAPVRDAADLRNKLALIREGSTAAVEFLRDGQLLSAQVTLAPPVAKLLQGGELNTALAGVVFQVSDPMIAGDIPEIEVDSVVDGSEAWRGGLRPGDIIISLNRKPVEDPNIFSEQLRQKPEHVYLGLVRKGRTMIALIR